MKQILIISLFLSCSLLSQSKEIAKAINFEKKNSISLFYDTKHKINDLIRLNNKFEFDHLFKRLIQNTKSKIELVWPSATKKQRYKFMRTLFYNVMRSITHNYKEDYFFPKLIKNNDIKKLGFLIKLGAFIVPHDKKSTFNSEQTWDFFFWELKKKINNKDHFCKDLLKIINRGLFFNNFWHQKDIKNSKRHIKAFVKKEYLVIFKLLLKKNLFEETNLWITICKNLGITFISLESNNLTNINLPISCPILEELIKVQNNCRTQMLRTVQNLDGLSYYEDRLDLIIQYKLNDDPFTEKQIRRLGDMQFINKNIVLTYCKAGYLKNNILRLLGRDELREIVLYNEYLIPDIFLYFNNDDETLKEIAKYNGLQHLFNLDSNNEDNLLALAIQNKKFHFLSFLHVALKSP